MKFYNDEWEMDSIHTNHGSSKATNQPPDYSLTERRVTFCLGIGDRATLVDIIEDVSQWVLQRSGKK